MKIVLPLFALLLSIGVAVYNFILNRPLFGIICLIFTSFDLIILILEIIKRSDR